MAGFLNGNFLNGNCSSNKLEIKCMTLFIIIIALYSVIIQSVMLLQSYSIFLK